MYKNIVNFVQDIYRTKEFIPLHAPTFGGNEKNYVLDTLDTTFVSSVGKYVKEFESLIENYTGATKAVATANGTSALHAALYVAGIKPGELVITQALTFVATCNVLYHMGVEPIFVDVSKISLGLCPKATQEYLETNAKLNNDGECIHKATGKKIKGVLPMHTFGHPVQLDELLVVCSEWNLVLVEDAAESLGSFYKGRHTGTVGDFSALSFNGNKIITTGGGGMVLCKTLEDGLRTLHVTTTAKVPHPYEFDHDEPGFNYRLPNLNAALGCAQIEKLPKFLEQKRELANRYASFFSNTEFEFFTEPPYATSNYWLNSVICPDRRSRDKLLKYCNANNVMARPVWKLMSNLPAFEGSLAGELHCSEHIEDRLVNIPSSPSEFLDA
jgi:UDP-N-acetylbacillosamine transaminase